jgi:hypothetical protein
LASLISVDRRGLLTSAEWSSGYKIASLINECFGSRALRDYEAGLLVVDSCCNIARILADIGDCSSMSTIGISRAM